MAGRFVNVQHFFVGILIIWFTSSLRLGAAIERSVIDYGAVGDGVTDDTSAFLKAWEDLCNSDEPPTLGVPEGKTFLLQPLMFGGPCKSSNFHFLVSGTIVAPNKVEAWQEPIGDSWISFSDVNGLIVDGNGVIDGQGADWWSDQTKNPKPRGMHFHNCNDLQLHGLHHVNSPGPHIGINACDGGTVSNIQITAPEDSPNTDGIDLSESKNIQITQSVIGTGDDCIAMIGGCSFINISYITCGPGHGISIGSLGKQGMIDQVEEVNIQNCNFTGTQNGARIKTCQEGSGYARKITFENISLVGSKNPIIIDQNYANLGLNGPGVKVSDVTYKNVHGTSASDVAITFDCANIGCENIVTDQVMINSVTPGKDVSASSTNAHGTSTSTTPNIPWS